MKLILVLVLSVSLIKAVEIVNGSTPAKECEEKCTREFLDH